MMRMREQDLDTWMLSDLCKKWKMWDRIRAANDPSVLTITDKAPSLGPSPGLKRRLPLSLR